MDYIGKSSTNKSFSNQDYDLGDGGGQYRISPEHFLRAQRMVNNYLEQIRDLYSNINQRYNLGI